MGTDSGICNHPPTLLLPDLDVVTTPLRTLLPARSSRTWRKEKEKYYSYERPHRMSFRISDPPYPVDSTPHYGSAASSDYARRFGDVTVLRRSSSLRPREMPKSNLLSAS
jgi:hypothetical protein